MILSPQNQLLERSMDLFANGEWLFVNPSDAYFLDELKSKSIDVMHQFFDIFSESVRFVPSISYDSRDIADKGFISEQKVGSHTHYFAPFLTTQNQYTDVMIYLPKAKSHFQMLLRMAAGTLKENGRIHVVGENKGGIKSAAKLMQHLGPTQKIDSARHCSLLTTQLSGEHLAFNPDDWTETLTYEIEDTSWPVVSVPGVFSHGELDAGTKLLLEKHTSNLTGKVMDFACGAGVIGSYLMTRYPHLKLTLLDVSALAIYTSAMTLKANNLNAQLIAANGLHGVETKVNHIVTNPPFHTGIKTDYTVTKRFIEDARRLLHSNGSLQMVANRFLPYPGLLSEHFSKVLTTAQTTQFFLYHTSF